MLACNQLRRAIHERNIQGVEQCLIEGANVNGNIGGMTPLNHAVYAGSLPIVEVLLKSGACVNQASICRDSEEGEHEYPIISAARGRNVKVVQLLIDHEVKLNVLDAARLSPLYYACMNGDQLVVDVLVKSGAQVNLPVGTRGNTALLAAVMCGHTSVVKILHSHGAEINYQDIMNNTVLHLAKNRSIDAVDYLLKHGAYLNMRNDLNHTAFESSVFRKHTKVAKFYLCHGCELTLTRDQAEGLLHAVSSVEDWEVIRMLVYAGVNVIDAYRYFSQTNPQQTLPAKLLQQTDLIDWLKWKLEHPATLKEMARTWLRQYFFMQLNGRSTISCIQQLPIPGLMKDYLTLKFS